MLIRDNDNIKMDLEGLGERSSEWLHLAKDREH
jgi:hypothetical protein